MNNPELLRRAAMIAMLVAVGTGLVSIIRLFTSPIGNPVWLVISVFSFLAGWIIDRRASQIANRKVG